MQQKLQFDKPSPVEASAAANAEAEDTSWRDVPITEVLTLTEKKRELLESCGVKSLGQFENLRAGQLQDYPRGLLSVKGVGEKLITEWENAVGEFWKKWRAEQDAKTAPVAQSEDSPEAAPEMDFVMRTRKKRTKTSSSIPSR